MRRSSLVVAAAVSILAAVSLLWMRHRSLEAERQLALAARQEAERQEAARLAQIREANEARERAREEEVERLRAEVRQYDERQKAHRARLDQLRKPIPKVAATYAGEPNACRSESDCAFSDHVDGFCCTTGRGGLYSKAFGRALATHVTAQCRNYDCSAAEAFEAEAPKHPLGDHRIQRQKKIQCIKGMVEREGERGRGRDGLLRLLRQPAATEPREGV